MTDTLPNVTLLANTWVDLYDATGITPGTHISVENLGVPDCKLVEQAAEPTISDGFNWVKRNGPQMQNSSGAAGAWAFCPNSKGSLNVRVIV